MPEMPQSRWKRRPYWPIHFKIPNFANTKWQDNASDSRLIISIANGKRKMPGYKGKLKDEEIVDLVKTCVRSFYPPPEQ
ncbi:MAG: cytochrome c [Candidatus Jettenia sp.]|nr:MAG: cytochrome c [Candidatus Jettenia sp.]